MTDAARPVLVVLQDGAPLAAEEARALWVEFSAHMDANEGDMAGFAKLRGWHAVAPEYRRGQAVLLVWTTAEAAAKAAPAPAPAKEAAQKPEAATQKQGGGKRPAGKGGGKARR